MITLIENEILLRSDNKDEEEPDNEASKEEEIEIDDIENEDSDE